MKTLWIVAVMLALQSAMGYSVWLMDYAATNPLYVGYLHLACAALVPFATFMLGIALPQRHD